MALTTRTVTGTYQRLDGSPASGGVTFEPNAALSAGSNDVMVPATPVTATLVNGAFTVTLVCTDNAGVSPTGWAYTVVERIAGADRRTYTISVPAGGSALDLADVTPLITVPTLVTYALQADLTTEIARAIAAEATLTTGKLAKPTATTLAVDSAPNATEVMADTGLSVTLGVGTYEFEFVMTYTGSVIGGGGTTLSMQLAGTATASALLYFIELQSSNATQASYTRKVLGSAAPTAASVVVSVSTEYYARVRGRITTTVGGTLKPQFALFTGATGSLVIKAASYGRLQAL